jgi:hypothetical protein
MKMQSFVMPAWIAGIQVRRMRPETSMSVWIPALHAGMTQSRVLLKLTETFRSVWCVSSNAERSSVNLR